MRLLVCLKVFLAAVLMSSAVYAQSFMDKEPYDPLESINRKTHEFNKGLDRYAIKPTSNFYGSYVPELIRIPISNFRGNLNEPRQSWFINKTEARKEFVERTNKVLKENLIVDDWSEKQYSPFIVNKSLSYSSDTVKLANEMNARPHIDGKLQYDFLKDMVRKKKRFNKWLKPEKEDSLELVKEYFGYNNTKAQEALRILSKDDLQEMERLMFKGGKI